MKSFKQLLNENQKIVIKKPWGVEIKDYKSGDPIPAGTKFKIFDAKDTAKIDAYADSLDESVVNEDSKRKPYLLKNAKVGDVFRDGGDLSREYKITKVTPSKVYATCVKQPSTTAEYNRSSSEYNEIDPQYTKLFTVNESTIKESIRLNDSDKLYAWMLKYLEKHHQQGSTALQFITNSGNNIIIAWNIKLNNGIRVDGQKMTLSEFCYKYMDKIGVQDVYEVDMNTGRFKTIKESLPSNYSKSKFLKEVEEACKTIEGEVSQIRKYAKASNFDMIETYYKRIANFSNMCAEGAKDISKYAKAGTLTEGLVYTSTKNLKVGDVFSENPKSTTWFKVDKIEGSKILTSNIDDKSDKLDISKYDDYKVFIKESVISEATMSDIPHEIDDQIHKLKDMRFDLEETEKNWKLAGMDTTPLTNVISSINDLIHTMYANGAQLADQEIVK